MKPKPPITREQVTTRWLKARREVVVDYGYALRAGEGNAIEFKSLNPDNAWLPLPLPRGAMTFATAADRDAVLKVLTEGFPGNTKVSHGAEARRSDVAL